MYMTEKQCKDLNGTTHSMIRLPIWKSTTLTGTLPEARLRVPRYLFRVFSATSRGSLEANNALSIIPDDPEWLYQASGDEESTRVMIEKHLMWDTTHRSEFTSWTSSLLCALRHAMRKLYRWSEHESRVYIAVLDTSNFAIPVWAATALYDAYGIRPFDKKLERHYYLGEYLVRGGISSANTDFRVASLQELRMEGLHEFMPELFESEQNRARWDLACAIRDDRDRLCRPGALPKTLTRSHVQLSRRLGECFTAQGQDSAVASAVAVALLAMRKWAHLFEEDYPVKVELEDMIYEELQGLNFPENFGGEEDFGGLANAHERYKPQEVVQFRELWQNLLARRPTENDLSVKVSRMSSECADILASKDIRAYHCHSEEYLLGRLKPLQPGTTTVANSLSAPSGNSVSNTI